MNPFDAPPPPAGGFGAAPPPGISVANHFGPVPFAIPSALPASNRLGKTALILGVSGIVSLAFCALVSVPLAIGAIGVGVKARKKIRLEPHLHTAQGYATAGICCGIATFGLPIFGILVIMLLEHFFHSPRRW